MYRVHATGGKNSQKTVLNNQQLQQSVTGGFEEDGCMTLYKCSKPAAASYDLLFSTLLLVPVEPTCTIAEMVF